MRLATRVSFYHGNPPNKAVLAGVDAAYKPRINTY